MRTDPFTILDIATDVRSSPRTTVSTISKLRALLAEFKEQEPPRFVELEFSNRSRLQLGLGGQFACAQLNKTDNLPPYLCAKAKKVNTDKDIEFLCGGTPTPIAPEFCLLFQEAMEIAEYFFRTGKPDSRWEWVEI